MNYIPHSDAEFNTWLGQYLLYAGGNYAALGLSAGQNAELQTAAANWTSAYALQQSALATAQSATDAKNVARAALETVLRADTAIVQSTPGVTDAQRLALGITPKAHAPSAPLPASTHQPALDVDAGTRLVHRISFADAGTPTVVAKPAGVMGCELWHKVGGSAPADSAGMTFLAVDTHTPYIVEYAAADVGQTVYYLGRWVSSNGEHGPWSPVVSATVGG